MTGLTKFFIFGLVLITDCEALFAHILHDLVEVRIDVFKVSINVLLVIIVTSARLCLCQGEAF